MKNIALIILSVSVIYNIYAKESDSNKLINKASFDCIKAHFPIEKKICETYNLAELDRILSIVYQAKTKLLTAIELSKLQIEQKSWITVRNNCLGLLPADEDNCLDNSYTNRIRELAGVEELIKSYQTRCQKNEWECFKLGELEIETGRLTDAFGHFSVLCEQNYDGDRGESCFKKANVLGLLGKTKDALGLYSKTCKNRQHNQACAMEYKLNGKKSKNPWIGLYRNSTGSIFVSELGGKKISIEADTNWPNGHYCGWNKKGHIVNNRMNVEIDIDAPNCRPKISKQDSKIIIEDPEMACKSAYCGARALFGGAFIQDTTF